MRQKTDVQLIGTSAVIRDLRDELARVARCDAKVLITGESGTGKEVVARTIGAQSLRAAAPFVPVNCAGLPENLLESELFGHLKGSFTGAYRDKPGKLEMARNGTIFLDEIGDMSLKTQAKVLRVLQEQELERLGSNRVIKVDVRVIAATNKNLEEAIDTGTFREDLFYRLNVVPIHVPPLRERREDIPSLVRHFADLLARENNFRRKTFSAPAMEKLKQRHWRGNIRELRNAVERLLIMSAGDSIEARDVPDEGAARADGSVPMMAPSATSAASSPATPPEPAWTMTGTLQEFKSVSERAYLVSRLRENGWNISKTAEVIDTPRSNLYKKLEQYQISEERDGK
ncbi:MAG: sigma-54 dependent transcriptional regulator [Vicinamibacterales bacterium]